MQSLRQYIREIIREQMQVSVGLGHSRLPGAGIGIFAKENIPKGSRVFKWNPKIDREYSAEYPDGLSPANKKEFTDLASWDGEVWSLAGDEGAYFNHADEPNVTVAAGSGKSALKDRLAARDIESGEELTMNYGEIGYDYPGK